MDHGAFRRVKQILRLLGAYRRRPRQVYSDGAILAVFFFAVLNDRAIDWAADSANWPRGLWRGDLPSQSCMSRRMREPRVLALLERVEHLARPCVPTLCLAAAIDGKPLEIALHSDDPHAGTGRGVGHVARGYKIHALVGLCGTLLDWRLAPLNVSEREMARRLLRARPRVCYIVGDAFYETNRLAETAREVGVQLVAPRKKNHAGRALGKRRHDPGRLRNIQMLEHNATMFALDLLKARRCIERFFSQWTSYGGGLTCLPPWVRTYPRVHAWVRAKLVLALLRGTIPMPKRAFGA